MTDSKALIERLRADWPEILVEKHWMMDSDAIEEQRREAADHIEKLEADNARLREALEKIAKPCSVVVEPSGKTGEGWKKMYYGWRKIAVDRVDTARAALQETSHDQ